MDAFSVSLANAMNEPKMRKGKMFLIAGTFAGFQALMPLIGWICVHTVLQYFKMVQPVIPWIALALLSFIGIKMIIDGVKGDSAETAPKLTVGALLIQGIATSIDALSVGFTIAEYKLPMALVCALIIAGVTFAFCIAGLNLGKIFGTKFAGKASIIGGIILIFIGIEICLL